MPLKSDHPSPEQLNAFNLGQLPPQEAVAIENHISECDPCCDTIVELATDDTFVSLLKDVQHSPAEQTMDEGVTDSPSLQIAPTPLIEHPRYEIIGLIGRGGMGDVYRARHRKMDRTVAIKVIKRGLVRKNEAVDRFHREVKAAAQLSHPNIVTAYDADQADDFHFMVMEYVDGVDLSKLVRERGALSIPEACDYIRQVALGLQHAHERGMVHRDIKPHNLMVTADGTVQILDFGLASLSPEAAIEDETTASRSDLTAAGSIIGTPDFMSPEQANDARQVDIRSDIYSLGATLYYLLSGQPLFAEGSVMAKLKSHASANPKALCLLREDVPEDLSDLVARMTAKNPDDRFQTPAEVAKALGQLVESDPSAKKMARPKWRRRMILGGVIVALMALAAVITSQESTADKLAKLKAPVELVSEPPEGTVELLFYTVEGDALDGQTAAICDIGDCRIAIVNQDISRTRDYSEVVSVVVTGEEPKRQRAIDSSKAAYFSSIYGGGEASCRFHNFNFTLTEKMIRFGDMGTFWKASPGILVIVDADTGDVITQAMTPMADRVFLSSSWQETSSLPAAASDDRPAPAKEKANLKLVDKVVSTRGRHRTDYSWKIQGHEVGELTVQLLLAEKGTASVAQEFRYIPTAENCDGEIRLSFSDEPLGNQQRRIDATLSVQSKGLSAVETPAGGAESVKRNLYPTTIPYGNSASAEPIGLGQVFSDKPKILFYQGFWDGDYSHPNTLDGIIEATKDQGTFVLVTLDWKAVGDPRIPKSDEPEVEPKSQYEAVREAIRQYYANKYPIFSALVNQNREIPGTIEMRRQIGELAIASPVSEIINSFPGKAPVTFIERTLSAENEITVVTLDLYRNRDGTCRVKRTTRTRPKAAGQSAARSKPISEQEVQKIVMQASSKAGESEKSEGGTTE